MSHIVPETTIKLPPPRPPKKQLKVIIEGEPDEIATLLGFGWTRFYDETEEG